MHPLVRTAALDGPLWLWLGAIGPLPINAERMNSTTIRVKFKEQLDPRIVEHFTTCEGRRRIDRPEHARDLLEQQA